ncbi:MAG: hemolysin family protein [Acidimicrobiia bacterium]|nr:hemolysin family protein [Acidimicrobiia bacterium]
MTTVALVISGALILLTAVLRAAGASLVRTPRADALHDARNGDPRAERIATLLSDRPRIQPALGLVGTALLVLAVLPAAWALTRLTDGWQLALSLVILGFVVLVFGDIVPRTLGRNRPRTIAYRFAWLLAPLITLGETTADLVADLDDEDEDEPDAATEAHERRLISQVIDFADAIVREVMVPRPDMVTVSADTSSEVALDLVLEQGKSRIPVYGEDTDDILGVLYARDLLQLWDEAAGPRIARDLMREAYFVPETKRVPDLLREMQANQVHMAIAVDEFGGTAGLVTIEDLLEELVGEIADEYDDEEPMVVPEGDGSYLIDARLDIDDLGELIGTSIPDEDWDTVGGLILGLAGRVPAEGESFEYNRHMLTVERVQGRRVAQIRLHP